MGKREKPSKPETKDVPVVVVDDAPVEAGKKTLYVVGVTKDAPLHHLSVPTLKGEIAVAFPCHTAELIPDGTGNLTLSAPTPGGKVELYADEVKALRANIDMRYIRWFSREERRGEIVIGDRNAMSSMRTRDQKMDFDPLANYLWLIPVEELSTMQAMGAERPPTIGEMQQR